MASRILFSDNDLENPSATSASIFLFIEDGLFRRFSKPTSLPPAFVAILLISAVIIGSIFCDFSTILSTESDKSSLIGSDGASWRYLKL